MEPAGAGVGRSAGASRQRTPPYALRSWTAGRLRFPRPTGPPLSAVGTTLRAVDADQPLKALFRTRHLLTGDAGGPVFREALAGAVVHE